MNYYNEWEPYAAKWLEGLSKAGKIPAGRVDLRSIIDVRAEELTPYTQAHFFAGLGGWSYALELAGWPIDRPVWTGSAPCQPFSNAGQGRGVADERHLWPTWFKLIKECRPAVLFGEQIADGLGGTWIDIVQADLEGEGYALGAAILPAAGVGAPHGRHRFFFVGVLADAGEGGCGISGSPQVHADREPGNDADGCGQDRMGNTGSTGLPLRERQDIRGERRREEGGAALQPSRPPTPWTELEWIDCRDGKRRPVPAQPYIFPLAARLPGDVGLLRASGNSICPQAAQAFIEAFLAFEASDINRRSGPVALNASDLLP